MYLNQQKNEAFYIKALLLIFLGMALSAAFQGFRMPSLWSINYFLPAIQDGFYRRSFWGTLFWAFEGVKTNYYYIATVQIGIFLGVIYLMYRTFMRNTVCALLIGLYLASPAGTYLFHEIGYIEQSLLLALLLALFMERKHPALASLVLACGIWMHEMALFFTIPIFFTALLIKGRSPFRALALSVPSLVVFLAIYLFGQTSSNESIEQFSQFLRGANYAPRLDYYDLYKVNFSGDRTLFYYNHDHILMLTCAAILAALSAQLISTLRTSPCKYLPLPLFVFLSGLSPLALGFFGWDVDRWIFLSVTSIMITLAIYFYEFENNISIKVLLPFALTFLFGVGNMAFFYFDGYAPRPTTMYELERFTKRQLFHEFGKNVK